jgi:pyruvate dehydrogenase E1 component
MPADVREGIVKGLYPFKSVSPPKANHTVQLLGSGVILNEVLRAQAILAEKYDVASTVFSATSYQELRRDAIECERWNRLHPQELARKSYVEKLLGMTPGPIVASSDYLRAVPELIGPYTGGRLLALGSDGFGRSDTRKALRRFFEIDAESVAAAALFALTKSGELEGRVAEQALKDLGIDAERPAPWTV